MNFDLTPMVLEGVVLIRRKVFVDHRGYLTELMRADLLSEALGQTVAFVQINHSHNVANALRGLHWQTGHPQGKLVALTAGSMVDVVVNIQQGHPQYKQHIMVPLAAGSGEALWIPPGYAHGFWTVDGADVIYGCSAPYVASAGRGVRWNDPQLAIPWTCKDPRLSSADASLPWLDGLNEGDQS